MTSLREVLASFDIEVDDKQLKKADSSIGGAIVGLKTVGAALAAAAAAIGINRIIGGVIDFTQQTIELGSRLNDTSMQLGVTSDALQRWQFIAGLAGVAGDTLVTSLGRMQRAASAAASGESDDLADTFQRLGVGLRDSSGEIKSADVLFREVGLAIGALPDAAQRTALAFKVFGRSGLQLLPVFANGAEGIAQLESEFQNLGGGLSGEFVQAADEAGDELDKLKFASMGLRSQLGVVLLPVLTDVVRTISQAVGWFARLAKSSSIVEGAAVSLAIALGLVTAAFILMVGPVFIPLLAGLALVALAFAVIALAIDDVVTFLRGGKSVIGRFLDSFLGAGQAKLLLAGLQQAGRDLIVVFEFLKIVGAALWARLSAGFELLRSDWSVGVDSMLDDALTFIENSLKMFELWLDILGIDTTGFGDVWRGVLDTARGYIQDFVTWASSALQGLLGDWGSFIEAGTGVNITAAMQQARANAAARSSPAAPAPTVTTTSPRAASVRRERGGRGARTVVAHAPVTINAQAASAREVHAIAERATDRRMREIARSAQAALVPGAVREPSE